MKGFYIMGDIIKLFLAVIVIAFIFSFVFGFLFKVGLILLVGLGVLYLFKKVFRD